MNRAVAVLALLVIITIGGGIITAGLGFNVPTIIQSTDPAASPFSATPSQALQFVLWILFVIVNVIGAGLTLAFILWLGSRELKVVEQMPNRAENDEALPETT